MCPHNDQDALKTPHLFATREDILLRLRNDRENNMAIASPSRDIFRKTSALIIALRKTGCPAAEYETTNPSRSEVEHEDPADFHRIKVQRGYKPVTATCQGCLSLKFNQKNNPYIKYELITSQVDLC